VAAHRVDPVVVAPLLRTKLDAPAPPPLVLREGLIDTLSAGASRPLTLIYGPAGSGKTMLAAQWRACAQAELPVAWLSLDAGDNDPARFWIYMIEALRAVLPGIGPASLAMLRAPGTNLIDDTLPTLINELLDVAEPAALVLDDYHLIGDTRIHAGMASMLEHLPPTLHIVITSRTEPPLGVATLRARAQLSEIDAPQLRFSGAEAESLLNDVHGLELSAEMVTSLHERTEGWAAGLYLAVLSMRGRAEVNSFIESFTGSDRRVVDYLGAEVLGEQSDSELAFLLATSVLDRFCAPLCDAVSGRRDARVMLDRIERSNYFLIPLDPRREWYRYHHLFGELLRHELERRRPGAAPELHRRAAHWFLDAGLVSEAIAHLTAAGELDAVSDLIAAHWLAFVNAGERGAVSLWLAGLPHEHISSDARMCLAMARTAVAVGEPGEILPWLDLAEVAPRYNPREDDSLQEQVTMFRALAWGMLGDVRQAQLLAQRLEPLDGSSFWHSLAAGLLGNAARWLDANDEAAARLELAMELGRGQEIAMNSMFALGQLALIAADRADWRACAANVDAAFDLVHTNGLQEYWVCSFAHLARGRLYAHDRRPLEARAEMERAVSLGRRGSGVLEAAHAMVTLGELCLAQGDRRAARELVLEARALLSSAPEPGTLVPRLVAHAEGLLRLVVHGSGARAVVTDELTEREQAVLSLLPSGLSAREIGDELGISRDTIKTHTKAIYRKLGASSRPAAVARGRELGLL